VAISLSLQSEGHPDTLSCAPSLDRRRGRLSPHRRTSHHARRWLASPAARFGLWPRKWRKRYGGPASRATRRRRAFVASQLTVSHRRKPSDRYRPTTAAVGDGEAVDDENGQRGQDGPWVSRPLGRRKPWTASRCPVLASRVRYLISQLADEHVKLSRCATWKDSRARRCGASSVSARKVARVASSVRTGTIAYGVCAERAAEALPSPGRVRRPRKDSHGTQIPGE
jgi:hypothetical protein